MKFSFVEMPKCPFCHRETDGAKICRKCQAKLMVPIWDKIAGKIYPEVYETQPKPKKYGDEMSHQRNYQLEHIERRLCTLCANNAAPNRKLCEEHLLKARLRYNPKRKRYSDDWRPTL